MANFAAAVELDISSLDLALAAAEAAKEGIAVSEDGTDVPAGAYWVTPGDMDALDVAIAAAEAARETVETQQDVAAIVAELEAAVSIFNEAKQEVTAEEEELEKPKDPVNEQVPEDDEEIVDELVDTEEDIDNGLESEVEAVDEEDAA